MFSRCDAPSFAYTHAKGYGTERREGREKGRGKREKRWGRGKERKMRGEGERAIREGRRGRGRKGGERKERGRDRER